MLRDTVKTSLPARAWPCPSLRWGKQQQGAPGEPKAGQRWTWGSSDLFRAETALDYSLSPFVFGFPFFLLSLQPGGGANSSVGLREKSDYVTHLCLEWMLAAGICSVSLPAPWLSPAGGGDPRGRTRVPGMPAVLFPARRRPQPPPGPRRPKPGVAAPSVARLEHGSSRPALSLKVTQRHVLPVKE